MKLKAKTHSRLLRLSYQCCLGTEGMWLYERVGYDASEQPVFSSTGAGSPHSPSTWSHIL